MRLKTSNLIILLLVLLCSIDLYAAHIVGGDFSYRHISGDTYEIKMKMYRDCGGRGAGFEQSLEVSIYDKETNQYIKTILMPRVSIYPIRFNTGCTSPQLRCVETGIFVGQFTMPKASFNNSAGYYVSWERCCRNNIIKNIVNPGATPMAFYMEIASPYPANGDFRVNSSPEFRRDPLNYLCVGEAFKYDFKAFDEDGDEIRISKISPLAGGETSPTNVGPVSNPGPYDNTIWNLGYSLSNLMDGNPDIITDNDTASIYLVPQQIGVYVISILCEEYRNGIKLGEIRRELQLEVLNCPIRFKPVASTSLGSSNTVDVIIGQQTCFDVLGSDGNPLEVLKVRIDTIGLYKLFSSGDATLSPSDVSGTQSISTKFCWTPKCPLDTSAGKFIDFIIYDNSCPFTQDDTVRVNFNFLSIPNQVPSIITNLPNQVLNIRTGETKCFFVQGSDGNVNDEIVILPIIGQVDIFNLGATITPSVIAGTSNIVGEVCWTPACGLNIDTPFVLQFEIFDNACPNQAQDTLEITVNLLPILNAKPTLIPEGTSVNNDNTVNVVLNQSNCFYVFGEDVDADDVDVSFQNVNYDFIANGAEWKKIDDQTNAERFQFCWTPTCDNFYGDDSLFIDFFVRDNKCENEKLDTLRILFKLQLPANDIPAILKPDSIIYNINAGYSRFIPVSASDADEEDLMVLSAQPLFSSDIPLEVSMQTISGNSLLNSELYIHADCGLEANTDFPVRIQLLSNKFCNENDTIEQIINLRVAPLLDLGPAMVPNAFSPNGDGINDEFKINLASRTICPDEFELKIYDRWGQILFETLDPEFSWKGEGQFPGAYVYYLRIGETKQTGFIALIK